MTKRHMLGHILSLIPNGISKGARKLFRGRFVTVLAYHRVMDRGSDFPFDDDLVSASPEQFEYQMHFVSKRYNVINFKQLKAWLDERGRLPENALLITFDDGYRDNYEVAFPILKRFGLTATMFVTAGFIGTDRLFWWDRIAAIVKKSTAERLSLRGAVEKDIDLSLYKTRQDAARHLIKIAKTLPEEKKEQLIEELEAETRISTASLGISNTMSWEHVKELASSGIEIGSHSVNHPIFSNISREQIAREVSESKMLIEQHIKDEVITFGAPGRGIIPADEKRAFEEFLEECVTESGYHFSTKYRWGLVYEEGFNPLRIARLGIETHDGAPIFRAKLSFPEIIHY